MKPLVTTVRALKELATGLSSEAVPASTTLREHRGDAVDVLLAAADTGEEQRVIVVREGNTRERYVPEHLCDLRDAVCSRLASFAERARASGPLSLPRPWHQYKHNNLIAFFAVPGTSGQSTRWIAEVLPGEVPDVVLWATTAEGKMLTLQEFEAEKPSLPSGWEEDWKHAVAATADATAQERRGRQDDVEISMAPVGPSAPKGWSYHQWLGSLSEDQRSFIEAATDRSIRLRGPAGSGKTLALTLKAIREVLAARERGHEIRVLIVTHSWALTQDIWASLDSMGIERLHEIDVYPLLDIAREISPQYVSDASGFSLIGGTDSFSGKQAQLNEIFDVLDNFIQGDWITYRQRVSDSLRARLDSTDANERFALAWDLLVEFGSVIGAAGIFPGAGASTRYQQLPRASWMLPLESPGDLRVVFALYEQYMASLDARSLLTADQVLADVLSHLVTHAWNRARRKEGYDMVFVDEFHLFSPLERQVLHYLSRDVTVYPRVFMAVDPRQSPSEAFIGLASDNTRSFAAAPEDELGDVADFELSTVHRFTPQILDLIKHVHHEFPTLDLGHDWSIDFSKVESAKEDGPKPRLLVAGSSSGEDTDIFKAVQDLYPRGRVALAVVDTRRWRRYSDLAAHIDKSPKYYVSVISARTDTGGLGHRSRGLVVGPAEYLAGLQFDAVLVAGVPDMASTSMTPNERTRLLSLLYLALSRAQQEVRIFVNEDDGGIVEVLARAVRNGLLTQERGCLV